MCDLSLGEECVDANYTQLIGGAVEFNYVFTDFLPAACAHF